MRITNEESSLLLSENSKGYTTIQRHDSCDVEFQRIDHTSGNTRWFSAALILTNIVLGTGLLNFPHVFSQAGGVLPCIIMQVFCLSLVQCSLLLIAKCADMSGQSSYQDIAQYYTGKFGAIIANIFIVLHDLGTCIAYLVLIADQIDQVMFQLAGNTFCHTWYMNRYFTLFITASIIVLPLCFPKDINSFRISSALGVFSSLYVVALVIAKYYLLTQNEIVSETSNESSIKFSMMDIFKVAPAIIFSFESHIEIVPIYASFKKRNLSEISKSIICTTILSLLVYNFVGIYGYSTFMNRTKSDILIAYLIIDIPIIIAMALVALKAILTYPVVFYCARLVFLQSMESSSLCLRVPELIRRVAVTVILFLMTLILALFVPSIGAIISLLGCSASLFIFVYPGVCFFLANVQSKTEGCILKMLFGAFYVIIGVFIMGATFTQSLISFKSGELWQKEIECI